MGCSNSTKKNIYKTCIMKKLLFISVIILLTSCYMEQKVNSDYKVMGACGSKHKYGKR